MKKNLNGLSKKNFMIIILIAYIILSSKVSAQTHTIEGAKIFHFSSSHTCFPETKRMNGYTNTGTFFDFANHYSDSSVLTVVPDKFHSIDNKIDIVFWFHGWHNNIDTALDYYHLASQFVASKRKAVLVLAEAAKNAADSYGGKLEQPNVFASLLQDVLQDLVKNKIISPNCKEGNIILAGHSGAYRVIAYILQNGNVQVNEVDLFDALYAETDKFMEWIKKDSAK